MTELFCAICPFRPGSMPIRNGVLRAFCLRRLSERPWGTPAALRALGNSLEIGMKWVSLEEETCSIARTLAVVGDRWSLLILRDCFLRVRRFEAFQSKLGITRHLLADRLKKLVRYGVLRRARYQESPARYE